MGHYFHGFLNEEPQTQRLKDWNKVSLWEGSEQHSVTALEGKA